MFQDAETTVRYPSGACLQTQTIKKIAHMERKNVS